MIKILSINIAEPKDLMMGEREYPTGIFKEPVEGVMSVGKLGFAGDTIVHKNVHGGFDQALYLYSQEDYDWWEKNLDRRLNPGDFGENLTVTGVDLTAMKVGDQLRFNNVLLEVTGPRIPCGAFAKKMAVDDMVKRFADAVRPGVYVRVIVEGELSTGEEGEYIPTQCNYVPIKALYEEWHRQDRNTAVLEQAAASPLSEHHLRSVRKWLDKAE